MPAKPRNEPRVPATPIPPVVLTVIVVHFESWPDVNRLLLEVEHDPNFHAGLCELIIADNDSRRFAPPPNLRMPTGSSLIRRRANDGFAAAVNDAIAVASGRWVLLLNPDVLTGPHFHASLLDRIDSLESRPDGPPAIVGFRLRNPDGSIQPSVGAFPSLAWCLREILSPRTRRKYQSPHQDKSGPVPWVTGACMLIRHDLLRRLGGLDQDFFLYHEEVALCRRTWDLGERVEFDPSIEVVHEHPLQNRTVAPRMRVITRHSKLLYFRKHLPRWQFEGLAAIIWLESLARRFWAAWRGRPDEQGAWRAVGQLPAHLRRDIALKGTAVLELAKSATSTPLD